MVGEKHLMKKVHEVLVMTLLEMLQFLMLIIVNWKNNFLVLGEGPTKGFNDSTVGVEEI